MAHGRNDRLFDRTSTGTDTARQRSERRFRAWHRLDPELRLSLVETALEPANDVFDDGFPIAL